MPGYISEAMKRDNIISVFGAVADNGCDTRADIAAFTGLSVVTTGKATDAFLDSGVFLEKPSNKKVLGRRAGMITIDPTKKFVIIDISGDRFETDFFNLSLKCAYTKFYDGSYDFSYTEHLCIFLHRIKAELIANKTERFCGIGLIVPGNYDKANDAVSGSGNPQLDSLKLREYIRATVGMSADVVMDSMSASLRYLQQKCGNDENFVYIKVGKTFSARLVVCGKLIRNVGPVLHRIPDPKKSYDENIGTFIADICTVIGIKSVYIEEDDGIPLLTTGVNIRHIVAGKLREKTSAPTVYINSNVRYAKNGCARYLRRCWLEHIIK